MKQNRQLPTLALTLSFALMFGCTSVKETKEDQRLSANGQARVEAKGQKSIPPKLEEADMVSAENESLVSALSPNDAAIKMHQPPLAARKVKLGMEGRRMTPVPAASQEIGFISPPSHQNLNTESYTPVNENRFINSRNDPLSTFSIDVDTASYANIRRFINQGNLPPVGSVRIEEMINYFQYDYPEPQKDPFSISIEPGPCPWNMAHRLVKIGVQAKKIPAQSLPPSNLVFLIDVSGSMNQENKLPLLKKSILMLVDKMRDTDRIGIVVYAGSDRVVLQSTPGSRRDEIIKAIQNLGAGGSTHASSGIHTAYKLAEQGFMPEGNNRVILASDGDFNVGVTTRGELEKLITDKRQAGVFLTVLGFGMGNYHDDTMEILADKGNGNYAYIDSLLEAKKVLIKEGAGTLFTLASDVKIQVEFNPALVGAYRLIGYENRVLADEDFRDDKKDAGEIGLGHSVTALYEIIPPNGVDIPVVDNLKYGRQAATVSEHMGELLHVKLRYKPTASSSSLLMVANGMNNEVTLAQTSDDFRFSAAVAGFGLLLKDSEFRGNLTYPALIDMARDSRGNDRQGYRAEFIRILETAELLSQ
ncbi:VWA domain-containing protein [Desulfopila sp. IMCC35008]|uniref:vWA domain-containing protein n=1 Tax=Desulfopila sp. IMCC35008 TaxID=2653858 RepID=UPI001F0E0E72|nr:VWA domain-containing protein [Desulfopila sp. IMCC35008]